MRKIINNNDIKDDIVDNYTNDRNICNDNENDKDVDGVDDSNNNDLKNGNYSGNDNNNNTSISNDKSYNSNSNNNYHFNHDIGVCLSTITRAQVNDLFNQGFQAYVKTTGLPPLLAYSAGPDGVKLHHVGL